MEAGRPLNLSAAMNEKEFKPYFRTNVRQLKCLMGYLSSERRLSTVEYKLTCKQVGSKGVGAFVASNVTFQEEALLQRSYRKFSI